MLEDEVKPELEELDNVEVEAILEDVVDLEGLLMNTARKWGFGGKRPEKLETNFWQIR